MKLGGDGYSLENIKKMVTNSNIRGFVSELSFVKLLFFKKCLKNDKITS